MDTATISFELDTTNPTAELGFEFWIDDTLVSDINHVKGPSHLEYRIPDDELEHQLKLVLKNKTWDHTKVDESGNIIEDACLSVTNIKFDDIELGQIFSELSEYHHQNNDPSGEKVVAKFYKDLGCNGYVVLNFSTPIYLWLLESM